MKDNSIKLFLKNRKAILIERIVKYSYDIKRTEVELKIIRKIERKLR